jgi:hypothetical protein
MSAADSSGLAQDGEYTYEERTVRPYAMTGGRTRPRGDALPIEALVSAVRQPTAGETAEKRKILELSGGQYLSIAELSAHVHLPVGVVRVIVGDLVDEGLARVHGPSGQAATHNPATTLSVLESVLNGISAL